MLTYRFTGDINKAIQMGESVTDKSDAVLNELAICYYYNKDYEKAASTCILLLNRDLSYSYSRMVVQNMIPILNNMVGTYTEYRQYQQLSKDDLLVKLIDAVKSKQYAYASILCDYFINKDDTPVPVPILNTNKSYLMLSITTCKRRDLFERTINSLLKCCLDIYLVSEWFCVDDNSSDEDREIMKKKYPFINFYFKTVEEKGHPRSMNIIRDRVLKSNVKYLFHLEDDFEFLVQDEYISKCIHVLETDLELKQCLINKNYAEVPEEVIFGGIFRTTPLPRKLRYYVHEDLSSEQFTIKYGIKPNCSYWPHFSFRPSIVDTIVYKEIGEFVEGGCHFEMDYANRYVTKGYKSGFLEGVFCRHIGKLTSEKNTNKVNSYDLNNQEQFELVEKLIPNHKAFVINMDRRKDRYEQFKLLSSQSGLDFNRFSAIDGSKLVSTRQLRRIFDPNNYNWSSGVIGCALSHISLWISLINDNDTDTYIITEDDVQFDYFFKLKLGHVFEQAAKIKDWDVIYLGTSRRVPDHRLFNNKFVAPTMIGKNKEECLNYTLGGNMGYIINKHAATKLLEILNITGMICAIDTMILLASDVVKVFFVTPDIVKTDCIQHNNCVDSDIQRGYNDPSTFIKVDMKTRIQEEANVFGKINIAMNPQHLNPTIVNISPNHTGSDIEGYKWYQMGEGSVYVHETLLPSVQDKLWFDRLKYKNEYSVENAIKYKQA